MAELSRYRWFNASDWGSLVRRILADTEAAADDDTTRSTARTAAAKRRSNGKLAPDDPRHGTENGYANYSCRCQRCCAANTDARNRRKGQLSRPQGDQHDSSRAMSRAGAVDSRAEHMASGACP